MAKFSKEQLDEIWKEMLNDVPKTEAEIRNKAIDELVMQFSLELSESVIWDMLATMSKNGSISETSDEIFDYVIHVAEQVAEQLKDGGENE